MASIDLQPEPSASVTIKYDQALPHVCARCGAPATTTAEHVFFEAPSKAKKNATTAGNFLLAMLSGYLVGSGGAGGVGGGLHAQGKSHKVPLPFCAAHSGLFKKQQLLRGGSGICGAFALMIPAIAIIVPIALSFQKNRNPNPPPLSDGLPFIILLSLVWLGSVIGFFAMYKSLKQVGKWIAPQEVTAESVSLDGVAPAFAAAVQNPSPQKSGPPPLIKRPG